MNEFLIENWRLIVELVLLVGSTVLFIVRKKPVKVIDTLKETIVRLLPGLINLAEAKEEYKGNGSAKLQFVLDQMVMILIDLGFDSEIVKTYIPFMVDQVEAILSTPQKKGN